MVSDPDAESNVDKGLLAEVEALKKQNEELRQLASQAADELVRLEKEKAKPTPQERVACGVKIVGPVDITPVE